MARQAEGTLPEGERTDELPALSGEAVRRLELGGHGFRAESTDALDRSLEALRDTLEHTETRWRQLESRLADQDRAIRELQDELSLARSDRFARPDFHSAGVPELTEIVTSAATVPTAAAGDPPDAQRALAADSSPAALLERIAALEAYIAGQNDHLQAVETELNATTQRIAELESAGESRA